MNCWRVINWQTWYLCSFQTHFERRHHAFLKFVMSMCQNPRLLRNYQSLIVKACSPFRVNITMAQKTLVWVMTSLSSLQAALAVLYHFSTGATANRKRESHIQCQWGKRASSWTNLAVDSWGRPHWWTEPESSCSKCRYFDRAENLTDPT